MNACNFLLNLNANNLFADKIMVRQGDTPNMRRLICKWDEIRGEKIQHHIYSAGIDQNNQIYHDCRRRLTYSKILISTLIRPFQCVRVLFHEAIMPLARAIFYGMKREIDAKAVGTQIIQTIIHLFRTPAYEIAMTIVGILGVLTGPFAPSTLYKFRDLIGKLEAAHLFEPYNELSLTPCFQPNKLSDIINDFAISRGTKNSLWLIHFPDTDYGIHSVENLEKQGIIESRKGEEKTYYRIKLKDLKQDQLNRLQEALAARSAIHYGRTMIKHRRKNYTPFYQLIGKLDPETTYISPAYDTCKHLN